MITEPRAAAGAHPSEELRIQSQLHREPKGEIVHCETGEAFSRTALLAAFSTASARFSSFLMRSSCAGRAAFCDCSDRTAGPRKASAAASTSVRRRMVFTGRAHGWRSPTLASGGCSVTVCSFYGCPNGYRSEMANCISASPALETLCGSAPFAPLVKVGEELVVEGGSTL